MTTHTIIDDNFDDEIKSQKCQFLLIFGLNGAVLARQLGLFLKKLRQKKKDKLKILKLNVDENPQTPQKFGVRGIPTLMLFIRWKPC